MASQLEVAEAMYAVASGMTPAKMPESLDGLGAAPQKRYLAFAAAAIEVIGADASAPSSDGNLAAVLAEALAWKLLHPQQFSESARDLLDRAAAEIDADLPEVRRAIEEL